MVIGRKLVNEKDAKYRIITPEIRVIDQLPKEQEELITKELARGKYLILAGNEKRTLALGNMCMHDVASAILHFIMVNPEVGELVFGKFFAIFVASGRNFMENQQMAESVLKSMRRQQKSEDGSIPKTSSGGLIR